MSEFKQYRKKLLSEMRPYTQGEVLSDKVSISPADRDAGSPKVGDMIARNPDNHDDQWLVAEKYFNEHFVRRYKPLKIAKYTLFIILIVTCIFLMGYVIGSNQNIEIITVTADKQKDTLEVSTDSLKKIPCNVNYIIRK